MAKHFKLKQETLSKFTRTNQMLDIPRRFQVLALTDVASDPTTTVFEIEWVDTAGHIQFTVVEPVDYHKSWAPILESLYEEVTHG